MSHHNDGMQLLALCKCTISIISAFHLYIWACLCLCVLFRSPAQRKASSLSPTHSTSAQTVLKLEEHRHANSGRHVPIDLKRFPLHLSLPDNMAVLAQGLQVFFFYTNSWKEKCKHKQVPVKQNEQLNFISHKMFLIRI